MRKLTAGLVLCLLTLYLALGVSAATGATKQESFATVTDDGRCQITTTVTLHLDETVEKLQFPVPKDASGVTLNGSRVSATRKGDVRMINLSRLTKNVVGDVTFSVHYSLYDVIYATDTGLQMQLPLLSGFDYPVEQLSFSVTLPGAVDALPGFVSGYHQARIEEDLTYTVEGATISGSSLKAMKDHETLYMTLVVTEQMFPQSIVQSQDYHWGTTAMLICGGLALVYWVIALWNLPVFSRRCTQPVQGYHPGQMGGFLAARGLDLSLTVLCWAQLGYVYIQTDRGGRVRLYKRMEMGNERSEGEVRIFQKLFGKRNQVDCSDYRYAQLSRSCAKQPVGRGEVLRKWSGKPQVFRFLASGIGLFGGASLAVALADGAALQGLLIVLLAVAGFFSGWYIQNIGAGLMLADVRKLKISLLVSASWLIFGLLAEDIQIALWMVLGLLAAGLLLAWGARRTRTGRHILSELLGFKHHLRTAGKKQAETDAYSASDYFFRMLPWAISLGCGAGFAKSFGRQKLEESTYISAGAENLTAWQWYRIFRDILQNMNRRADNLPVEKFFSFVGNLTRK